MPPEAEGARNSLAVRGMSELGGVDEVALMVNVANPEFAIIDASRGYLRLMGLASHEVLGRGLQQVLTTGAPLHAVSKSANHDLNDFSYQCSLPTVEDIGETVVVQPASRADGTQLAVLSLLGLCRVHERRCALVVQAPLGEGVAVRVSAKTRQGLMEQCRQTLLRLRKQLGDQRPVSGSGKFHGSVPARGFFRDRLQGHCVLSNGSLTATRREKDELQNGCLVFSDRPIPISEEGLEFSLKIDSVAAGFEGLPLLGFTRRQPKDTPDLYPVVASCLGESVLVGGQGCKAYARDQHEHFVMGFRLPPQHEVQTWPTPESQPRKLRVGDIVRCTYTLAGIIQLFLNDEVVLDVDIGRPVQRGARYYAVVDVCFTAGSMTMLPSEVALSEMDTSSGTDWDELIVDTLEDGPTTAGPGLVDEFAEFCGPDPEKVEQEQHEQDEGDVDCDTSPCSSWACYTPPVSHRRSERRRTTTASMASTVASEADLGDYFSESDDGISVKKRTFAADFPAAESDGDGGKLDGWQAQAPSTTSTALRGKLDGWQAQAPSTTSTALRGCSVAAVVLGSCAVALAMGRRLTKP